MSDKLVAHSFGAQLAAVDEEDIPDRLARRANDEDEDEDSEEGEA